MTAKLPSQVRALIEDSENTLFFSSASIWELSVKHALRPSGIPVHPRVLQRSLLDNDFREVAVTSEHAFVLETLPPIHKDPFDRILIAQAMSENMLLVTSDETVAQYTGPIRLVR